MIISVNLPDDLVASIDEAVSHCPTTTSRSRWVSQALQLILDSQRQYMLF